MLDLVLYLFYFLLGTIVGSFLNVVVLRGNLGSSLSGRSRCPSCGKKLSWFELIPIFSFFLQRGRCRSCGATLSLQYPAVEFSTGVLFLLTAIKYPPVQISGINPLSFFLISIIWSVLVVLAVYDFREKILPDKLILTFIFLSFVWRFFLGEFSWLSVYDLLAGPVLFLFFFSFWFFSKGKWMGLGDAKLALGMGIFLSMQEGITAVVISFWVGAAIALALMFLERFLGHRSLRLSSKPITMKSEIPFGPFLILGTIATFLLNLNLFESLVL